MQALAYAYGEPGVSASIKVKNEDFQVREILNFEPDGEGDHLFLLVEKDGLTTQNVQKRLMRHFKVPGRDVSFSGMKDKQAITQQWFSVKIGNQEPGDIKQLNSERLKIRRQLENKRKLKRGSHSRNQFEIRLRNLSDKAECLVERLRQISKDGVPNYFGEQRFGKNGENVEKAMQLFTGEIEIKDRYQRGIYISAARAFLFNKVLSKRVEDKNWNTYLTGDLMCLDASSACFKPELWDQTLAERLNEKDIHPSGPLWGAGVGKGKTKSEGVCAALEEAVLSAESVLKSGLEQSGLQSDRRALRSMPIDIDYEIEDDETMLLKFTLNKGSYATAFLRELVKLRPLQTVANTRESKQFNEYN
jgi:tRNA pseudouridine13 synthase